VAVLLTWGALGGCDAEEPVAGPEPELPAGETLVYRTEGLFGGIWVVDRGPLRVLRFGGPDGLDQTQLRREDPDRLVHETSRFAAFAWVFADGRERALVIGLGGGSYSTFLHRTFPELVVDAVEIDPAVVDVAQRFFGVPRDERLQIHVEDGGVFVEETPHTYDLVMVDAFGSDEAPPHLVTRAFFEKVRSRVAPGGVAVLNIPMAPKAAAEVRNRFAGVLPVCFQVQMPKHQNVIVIGRNGPRLTEREVRDRIKALVAPTGQGHTLWRSLDRLRPCEGEALFAESPASDRTEAQ
jgi:spermidine synthase